MKRFHQLSALALLLLAGSASLSAQQSVTPVDHVSTLVGSASKFSLSTGNTYPAIALPWGMNFWVPQTGKMGDGWQYTYDANQIRGFKQTHQPSPWINDYGQFAIMPTVGKVDSTKTAVPAGSPTRQKRPRPIIIRYIWPTTT